MRLTTHYTGVAVGGTRGTRAPYSVIQKSAKNEPKRVIFTYKIRTFLGTSPYPFPAGRGHPSSWPTFQVPPLQLDSGYATDSLASTQDTIYIVLPGSINK